MEDSNNKMLYVPCSMLYGGRIANSDEMKYNNFYEYPAEK